MEVQQYYSMSEIVISGKNIPKPIVHFSEAVFPGNSLVFVVFYLIFQDWWKSPVLHVSCFLMWLDTHEPMYEAAISLSWAVKSQYTRATRLTVTFSTESACLYRLEGCSSIFSMRLFCLKTGLACSHSSLVLVFKSFF